MPCKASLFFYSGLSRNALFSCKGLAFTNYKGSGWSTGFIRLRKYNWLSQQHPTYDTAWRTHVEAVTMRLLKGFEESLQDVCMCMGVSGKTSQRTSSGPTFLSTSCDVPPCLPDEGKGLAGETAHSMSQRVEATETNKAL